MGREQGRRTAGGSSRRGRWRCEMGKRARVADDGQIQLPWPLEMRDGEGSSGGGIQRPRRTAQADPKESILIRGWLGRRALICGREHSCLRSCWWEGGGDLVRLAGRPRPAELRLRWWRGEGGSDLARLASMEVGGGAWGVGTGWRSEAEWGDIDGKSDRVNLKLIGWADYWAGPSLFSLFSLLLNNHGLCCM
jgi:hypothetical protein